MKEQKTKQDSKQGAPFKCKTVTDLSEKSAGNVILFVAVALIVFPLNSFIARREAEIL